MTSGVSAASASSGKSTAVLVKTFSTKNYRTMAIQGQNLWLTGDDYLNQVEEVNGLTGATVRIVKVGASPSGVTVNGKFAWVTNAADNTVSEIAVSSGKVVNTISVGTDPTAITSDASSVWVANTSDNTVSEIDAASAQVVNTLSIGASPTAMTDDGVNVFVGGDDGSITQIAVANGSVTNTIQTPACTLYSTASRFSLASDGTNLWASNPNCGNLYDIQIADGSIVATDALPATGGVTSLAVNNGTIWLGLNQDNGGLLTESTSMGGLQSTPLNYSNYIEAVVASGPIVWGLGYGSLYEVVEPMAPTSPTISNIPANARFRGSFTPSVVTNGDGVKSFTSLTVDVCSISGGVVSFDSRGTCTLEAHVRAGTYYTAGNGAPQSFTVDAASPTVLLIKNKPTTAYVGSSFHPVIQTNADGPQSVISLTTDNCSYQAGVVKFLANGVCTLQAHVDAGASYQAADGSPQSFNILPPIATTPTISNMPTFGVVGASFQPVISTNGDGIEQVISSTPAICRVTPSTNAVRFTAVGVCSLKPLVGNGITFSGSEGATARVNVVVPTVLSSVSDTVLSPSWSQRRLQAVISVRGSGYSSLVVHYGLGTTRNLNFSASFNGKDPAVANIVLATLVPSKTYSVQVTASGPAGSVESNVLSITTPSTPSRPVVVSSSCRSTQYAQDTYLGYSYSWRYFYRYKLSSGGSSSSPVYEVVGGGDPCK